MGFIWGNKRAYSDVEVVGGLQKRDALVENWFYEAAKKYFNAAFNEVFFDKDRKLEIFQTSFIKLWTEIENGRIKVVDGAVCRQQRNGAYEAMNCSLTTFLMAFAKTEYRELVRNIKEVGCDELYDAAMCDTLFDVADYDEVDELKDRIVDECIARMSPSCMDILTMFYYRGMSLDEILAARSAQHSSKDGLKSAKNKCLSTLKAKVKEEFLKCNINI